LTTTTTRTKPRILIAHIGPGWRVRVKVAGRIVYEGYESTKQKARDVGLTHAFEHNRGHG
jgi:hypothetical protein